MKAQGRLVSPQQLELSNICRQALGNQASLLLLLIRHITESVALRYEAGQCKQAQKAHRQGTVSEGGLIALADGGSGARVGNGIGGGFLMQG